MRTIVGLVLRQGNRSILNGIVAAAREHIRPGYYRERAEIAGAWRVGLEVFAHVAECTALA